MYILFLLLFLHTQYACQATPLIGDDLKYAQKKDFPFIVSLSWNIRSGHPERNHFCGGTLIMSKYVLTAAHCLAGIDSPDKFIVRVKSVDLQTAEARNVQKWITYDTWVENETIDESSNETINDIAIIELTKRVVFQGKRAVITNIPESRLYGKKVRTAGWGITDNDEQPRYLLTAELNMLNAEQCLINLNEDLTIRQTNDTSQIFLCTSADPPVTSQCGDSGSPLIMDTNVIVAVNRGDCFRKSGEQVVEKQNLHVSVYYYRKFIYDVTGSGNQYCCVQ